MRTLRGPGRRGGRGGPAWRGIRGVRAALLGALVLGLLTCWLEVAAGQEFTGAGRRSLDGPGSEATSARENGRIAGTVTDATGAMVPGARVTLALGGGRWEPRTMRSGEDGAFCFEGVPAGLYTILIEREGFQAERVGAALEAGGRVDTGEIALRAALGQAIEVRASRRDVAEAQMELQEKQRVLGVFPNFYASYAADPEPLSSGEKFRLAERFSTDPIALAMAGVVAGSEQRANTFPGYGRGPSGYAKRFGAAYTDGLTSTLLGQAVFPALLRQDPRYFVKGMGSVRERAIYAVVSAVMCRGDSRRRQVNYSNLLGNFTSAGISNAYYPAASRGVGLMVQNALTATAMGAVGGLFQEFFLHRMTPKLPLYGSVGQ